MLQMSASLLPFPMLCSQRAIPATPASASAHLLLLLLLLLLLPAGLISGELRLLLGLLLPDLRLLTRLACLHRRPEAEAAAGVATLVFTRWLHLEALLWPQLPLEALLILVQLLLPPLLGQALHTPVQLLPRLLCLRALLTPLSAVSSQHQHQPLAHPWTSAWAWALAWAWG